MVTQVYRPRKPKESPLWKCLCRHFYDFMQAYPGKYESKYGFLKPAVEDVVNKYLDCGDLSKGFARLHCAKCNKDYLLAFSCKGRWFCPSCHQKKVLLFGEFIKGSVAYPLPHRQYVFSLPNPSTRCKSTLLRVSLERKQRELFESKPAGCISHRRGEKCRRRCCGFTSGTTVSC